MKYAAEMKRRGLRVPFECITRADRMNARVARTLAELGCFRVWIGSESGSQRILDAMQRGVRVEQVRDAVRLLREHGIETGMFLMWGYEGEDLRTSRPPWSTSRRAARTFSYHGFLSDQRALRTTTKWRAAGADWRVARPPPIAKCASAGGIRAVFINSLISC